MGNSHGSTGIKVKPGSIGTGALSVENAYGNGKTACEAAGESLVYCKKVM